MKLKLISAAVATCVIATPLLIAQPTEAKSSSDCEIWVCLPGGFASGSKCGPAFRKMVLRLITRRSPLPPMTSCLTPEFKSMGFNASSRVKVKKKLFSRTRRIYVDTYTNGVQQGGYYIKMRGSRIVESYSTFTPPSVSRYGYNLNTRNTAGPNIEEVNRYLKEAGY